MRILIGFLLYTLLFVSVEILTKKKALSKEISRKIVHIVAGIMAAALPFFMNFHQTAILSSLFIPVMYLSKRFSIFTSIHDVTRSTYGEVYFPLAMVATALLFPIRAVYIYGILVMALSDGFASVFGQLFGQQTYQLWRSKKSYAGSLTFFLITFAIGIGAAHALHTPISFLIMVAAFGALIMTLVEAVLSYGLDNLVVPPFAALLFWSACKLFRIL